MLTIVGFLHREIFQSKETWEVPYYQSSG